MPYYQCLKTKNRDVYCSSTEYRSHAEAKQWVTACMANFQIRASQLLSTYEADSQPDGAIIYP